MENSRVRAGHHGTTTVAIVQARMGSTRLPGKVLADLGGEPVLSRVVSRVRRAIGVDLVVVATTVRPGDDPVAELCRSRGWAVYRGSEEDVLDRFRQAADTFRADVIVRVTADCPLLDPALITSLVGLREERDFDYCSNTVPPRTTAHGMDVEVLTVDALGRAWDECHDPALREHVTPHLYLNPDAFTLGLVREPPDDSWMRLTLDTPEDLDLLRRVWGHFDRDDFTLGEIRALLKARPDWVAINRDVVQRSVARVGDGLPRADGH